MGKFAEDLNRLGHQLERGRAQREVRLAEDLLLAYRQARLELQDRFIELLTQQGADKFELAHLDGTLRSLDYAMRQLTAQTAALRQSAIDDSYQQGQQLALSMLQVDRSFTVAAVSLGIGQINRPMVEALIGNVPQLAGKVSADVLNRIRHELTISAIKGDSIPQAARRVFGTGLTQEGLKRPFSSVKARATVIARTEIIKASDAGYQSLVDQAQAAIEEEIFDAWITAHDDRVDAECKALEAGTNPAYPSVPGHPGLYRHDSGPRPVISTHAKCRCRRTPVLLSWLDRGLLDLGQLRGQPS